jgi:hypothetical protein
MRVWVRVVTKILRYRRHRRRICNRRVRIDDIRRIAGRPWGSRASASCKGFAAHQATSAMCRYCCKSLFALVIRISFGCTRDFRVNMWGTSLPEDKLAGGLGNVIGPHRSAVVGRIFLQQENWRRAIWDFCNNIGTTLPIRECPLSRRVLEDKQTLRAPRETLRVVRLLQEVT